jgi:hypothetical protein
MNAQFNSEEVAICKRRGHEASSLGILYHGLWSQCKWCGLWLREVRQIEQREDAPPVEEQAPTKVSLTKS